MPQVKELLIRALQDLLHAETQLTGALPKMTKAANHPKLKEAFEKHLGQTQLHVERLQEIFGLLGEKVQPKPCKGMMGLIEEGQETIEEGANNDSVAADLALIAAAQKVEHYEIASYGTARVLARQLLLIRLLQLGASNSDILRSFSGPGAIPDGLLKQPDKQKAARRN